MHMTESRSTLDWLDAGWAVFHGEQAPEYFPPLNDMEARRCWLGDFGTAWAEHPDPAAVAPLLESDGNGGEGVEEALVRALAEQEEPLARLRAFQSRRMSRTLH
jgi:hypothetical protein